jgi:hypothetical protein
MCSRKSYQVDKRVKTGAHRMLPLLLASSVVAGAQKVASLKTAHLMQGIP